MSASTRHELRELQRREPARSRSPLAEEIRGAVEEALEGERERVRMMMREELMRASTAGDPDELWPAEQVAKFLHTTPIAIRCKHERGTLGLEAVRVGKRSLRWRAGDVRALARARTEKRR